MQIRIAGQRPRTGLPRRLAVMAVAAAHAQIETGREMIGGVREARDLAIGRFHRREGKPVESGKMRAAWVVERID